jgi:hypothetical protein
VHDAVLIEASAETIQQAVADMQRAMEEASEIVLDGFKLKSDAKVVVSPNRYMDKRGERMWERVMGLLSDHPNWTVTLFIRLVASAAVETYRSSHTSGRCATLRCAAAPG